MRRAIDNREPAQDARRAAALVYIRAGFKWAARPVLRGEADDWSMVRTQLLLRFAREA